MIAFLRETGDAVDVSVPPTIQALLAARLDRLDARRAARDRRRLGGRARVLGARRSRRSPDDGETGERARDAHAQAARRAGAVDARGRDGLRLQPHPRPRRRLRVDHQGGPRRAARAARGLARAAPSRAHDRDRGDRRPPPRARLPLPLRPRPGGRALVRARAARRGAPRRPPGARAARAREDTAAVGLLERAGALLPATARERLELLPAIGESLEGTANHTKAGEIYEEALERALSRPASAASRDSRASGARTCGSWPHPEITATAAGRRDRARDPAARAHRRGARPRRRLAAARRGAHVRGAGRATGSRRSSRRSRHADPDTLRRGTGTRSRSRWGCACSTAPRTLERAVDVRAGAPRRRARAQHARDGGRHAARARRRRSGGAGDFDEARAALSESTAISEDMGLLYMAQWSKRSRGRMELAAGDAGGGGARAARELGRADADGPAQLARRDRRAARGGAVRAGPLRRGRRDAEGAQGRMGQRRREHQRAAAGACARSCSRRTGGRGSRRRRRTARCASCAATDWLCLQVDALLAHAEVMQAAGRQGDALASARGGAAHRRGEGLRGGRDHRPRARPRRGGRRPEHATTSACRCGTSSPRSPRRSRCRARATAPRSRCPWPRAWWRWRRAPRAASGARRRAPPPRPTPCASGSRRWPSATWTPTPSAVARLRGSAEASGDGSERGPRRAARARRPDPARDRRGRRGRRLAGAPWSPSAASRRCAPTPWPAALLAQGAARAAATLVEVNLGTTSSDPRVTRARDLAGSATAAAERALATLA